MVHRVHTGRIPVYDIQVEGCRNFFANDVLVHNCILIDDPIRSAADADSQTVRDALWEWYQGTLRTRLQPGGSIILTATRWHGDDLTGRLLDAAQHGGEQWEHVHMPAISEAGHALWPEYWTVDALEKIRQSVGSRVWEAQYQGRPQPAEGGIIKRHWLNQYTQRPPTAPLTIQSWDTAFKDGVANDYSVCATFAYGPNGAYLLDVYRDRIQYPDLERMAVQQRNRWRPSVVLIEDKASGQSLIQSLRRNTDVPVIAVPVTKDKVQRVNEVSPGIEAGRLLLPVSAPWLDDVILELTTFPNAAHDDVVDSISQALTWLFARDLADQHTGHSWLPDDTDDDEDDPAWLN